ncbi:MAG: hypothetical protein K2N63_17330, partial [Lachnospiraceae bacterium]|nr:hypothetical protein [Lachnospiraceae bacterium]
EELIRFNTFLGKKEENETLYLEFLASVKQEGKWSEVVSVYKKVIHYYLDMGNIVTARKYLDEVRGILEDQSLPKNRLFLDLLEEALKVVCLEREGRKETRQDQEGEKENHAITGLNENICQKQQETEELWEWVKRGLRGVKNWYGNLYTGAIAAAKAMEDPYVKQLEKGYKAWCRQWKI